MKNGFREVVDKILRRYGLKTSDCVGTVWADGDISWKILNAMGYRVEQGIANPEYDYVILSKGKSTIGNLLTALTKVKLGCIIIFRADGIGLRSLMNLSVLTKSTLSFYTYDYNSNVYPPTYKERSKILGVLFKGKEV